MSNSHQNSQHLGSATQLVLRFILVLITSVILGFVASKGELIYIAIALFSLLGLVVALNYKLLLAVTLIGGLLVSGVVQLYFPQWQLIRWVFGASATFLLLHICIQAINVPNPRLKIDSAILFWSWAYIGVLVISSLLQSVEPGVLAISLKGYLQMWGAFLAIALLPWASKEMDKLPLFVLAVALIQIPFVLHQFLFLVPMREQIASVPGLVPIDIVSGTFGGKIDHGGANSALTLLCFITGAGLTALWKNGQLRTGHYGLLIVLAVFPAFINSTKISILYLLILFFVIYADEIAMHPIKTLMRCVMALSLCALIAFSVLRTLPESTQVSSFSELIEQTYNYNLAEDTIRDDKLSRSGAIKTWFNPVKPHGFKKSIFGYGLGASRMIESDAGSKISEAINLPRAVGVTALAAILWETGVIGVLAVSMLFLSALLVASKLKRLHANNGFRYSIFNALEFAVIILFVSLGHKSYFVFHIGFQSLFVIVFGYLAYWERNTQAVLADSPNFTQGQRNIKP